MPFTDDPPHHFTVFSFFDYINKIEIFQSIHKEDNKVYTYFPLI